MTRSAIEARGAIAAFAVVAGTSAACAPAMRPPPPLPAATSGRTADELLREANAAWAQRAMPGKAAEAAQLYTEAASTDESRIEGLVGAMTALGFQAERERDGATRERLAQREVELGQWCQRRVPDDARCDYRLAIALGQLARERTSTAHDALSRMVDLLRKASTEDPRIDEAGPHRVLALVQLRAPAWPLGPGDPDAALEDAQAAVALFPDAPQNQLALGEVLEKAGRAEEARAAYERAAALAARVDPAKEPDALRWREDAAKALARGGGS